MTNAAQTYSLSAAIGALAGMRSMAAPAALSHALSRSRRKPDGGVARILSSRVAAGILKVLAAGEIAADKHSATPARTDVAPLAGRAVIGSICAVAIAQRFRGPVLGSAVIGGASAVGAAYAAYYLRKMAGELLPVPDQALGAAEDLVVVSMGTAVANAVEDEPESRLDVLLPWR